MKNSDQLAWRMASLYCLVAGLWILFSDRLLVFLVTDADYLTQLQTYKGLAFVAVTSGVFYGILRRHLGQLGKKAGERIQAEQLLIASEERYHRLFEHMNEGVAYCRMISEAGQPKDFVYLAVNPMFTTLTGLKDVVGKRVTEVIPGIRESDPELFEIYGRVARTGQPEKTERFVAVLQMWFELAVYSPEHNFFVAVFDVITERKQTEKILRASEERYRALFDRSLDCVFLADFAGNFLDANQAALDLLGYQREDILTISFGSLLTEDQLPLAFQAVEEIRATGFQKQPTEFRLRCKDGRQVVVETQSSLIYRDGKPYAIQGIARNITERKQVEESLRLFRALIDQSNDFILVVDLETGRFLDVNERGCLEMGYSREEFLALRVSDIDPTVKPSEFPNIMAELKKQGVLTWQGNHRRKDGSTFLVEVSLKYVRLEQDYVVAVARNITERKRTEETNDRLATAVEQAAETIVITDRQGTILYVNPAFEKSTGYTRAEAIGQNPRILKSGKQNKEFYRQMWEVLTRGEVWHGHFSNRHKSGTIYEEESTISPVRDAAGAVVNFVAVKRDVTHEVELESQIRQTQKMDAIGQLAAGVAHDFNNILAVIQLQAGILKAEQGLSPKQLEMAGEIEKATGRAADLTRQLLLFSRKQALHQQDMDLNDIVTSIAKMLQRVLGDAVEIKFKLAPTSLMIHADATMMDQVLMNLTVNARDAMPQGGQILIESSAMEFDEVTAMQNVQARPGLFACLSVSDTGTGIPPEVLPKIFEPFFTTKEVGKGSGLGLSTVLGVVQQHKGWISVYSEVGLGTTFRIYLPCLTKTFDNKALWTSLASVSGGRETILLAEDDSALRDSIQTALDRLGYRVLGAANGAEALALWQQHRSEIKLLLTDMVMPGGMNGKELAQRLQQENPQLKVIYASGYSADLVGKDLRLKAGVNFLAKPYEAHKLAEIVRNNLDRS